MKSSSLTEVKEYVKKLKEHVDAGIPKGRLLNKYQKKNILIVQAEQVRVLNAVLKKITAVENK